MSSLGFYVKENAVITTRTRESSRRPKGFSISMDLSGNLTERFPLDADERARLTEPVALLVELGDVITAANARQLARELRGRGQLQAIVTRRGRGGQQLVKVMAVDTLCAYAADCDQTGRLIHLERTLRKAA
ncbi:hypothetical protein AB0L75_34715 [Streptomyces sp. NPDC052101]|uniref:hypothetical protein n=1 Tax=Streptomyces sp. NPDC052101 TaxID=3155763 RepID=UPI00343F56BF